MNKLPKKNENFIEDIISVLLKHMENEEDMETCRWFATHLLYESINVMYQNSPNKKNFESTFIDLSEKTVKLYLSLVEVNYNERK